MCVLLLLVLLMLTCVDADMCHMLLLRWWWLSSMSSDGHGCPMGCFWLTHTHTCRIPVPRTWVQDSRSIPVGSLYIELNNIIII